MRISDWERELWIADRGIVLVPRLTLDLQIQSGNPNSMPGFRSSAARNRLVLAPSSFFIPISIQSQSAIRNPQFAIRNSFHV